MAYNQTKLYNWPNQNTQNLLKLARAMAVENFTPSVNLMGKCAFNFRADNWWKRTIFFSIMFTSKFEIDLSKMWDTCKSRESILCVLNGQNTNDDDSSVNGPTFRTSVRRTEAPIITLMAIPVPLCSLEKNKHFNVWLWMYLQMHFYNTL